MESIKEYFKENRCFYLALLLLLMGFVVWCYVSGRGTAEHNSTDRTVDTIETESGRAADSIGNAGREVENAEDSIRRAQDAVESGQRAAEEVSDGISECQDLAHESRKLNTDIADLLRDIEAASRKRTQDSEKNHVAK